MQRFHVLSPFVRSAVCLRSPLWRNSSSATFRRGPHLWQPHIYHSSRLTLQSRPIIGFTRTYSTLPSSPRPSKPQLWSRLVSFVNRDSQNLSSFRKIVALAKPERKSLGIAVCLLLVSSAVSMSIPMTVGKLIDYFTTSDPVCRPPGLN
jgi:hypothetical protein